MKAIIKYKIVKLIIIILVLGGIATAYNNRTEQTSQSQTGGIVTIKTEKNNNIVNVYFKNNTGKKINYLTIKLDCYNKDNINIYQTEKLEKEINTKDTYKTTLYATPETDNIKVSYKY